MKNKILLFSFMLCYLSVSAQDLGHHRWQDRVILLFAERAVDPLLRQQLDSLTQNAGEVTDRDLVIYQFFPNEGIAPGGKKLTAGESSAFFGRYDVQRRTFTFILVGKDGGEKLRSISFVPLKDLFALIDGMPMRRAEMRKRDH